MTTIPTEVGITLSGTASQVVDVAVGDDNGNILTGDVFDAGATITVADGTVCTAVLSTDQTNITVTGLGVAGSTQITMDASVDGVALTDFGGPLLVTTTVAVDAPATVVFTPVAPTS